MKLYLRIAIIICCFVQTAHSNELYSLLSKNDSLLVTDCNNKIIYSKNSNKKLIPASIIKVLTSLTAFHYLGEDFRFKTEFYLTANNDFVIKGYGDPLLISEVIEKISAQLILHHNLKNIAINNIILDNSYFANEPVPGSTADSSEPYDAQTGALCVNFNTVNFTSDSKGNFISAEPQTPLLPFVLSHIKKSKLNKGRIILTGVEKDLYPGYLFKYFLGKNGISVSGNIEIQNSQIKEKELIYTYLSEYKTTDLVSKLLEFSNNFIANQIFLALGAAKYGEPANLRKSIDATNLYIKKINKPRTEKIDYYIVEGSGLSRLNRISAKSMMRLLELFEKNHTLMRKNGYDFYKTGTLKGISTRAGYLVFDDTIKYRYVIMCNEANVYAKSILDKVIRKLQQSDQPPHNQ